MRTRGLTLFEVLLALALLVAMAALTLPSVMNSLHEQSFAASSDLLKDQFLRARAYAQAEGEAVEIRYHTSLNMVETRLFIPGRNAEEREDVIAGEMFTFEKEENSDLVIAEGWALQDLPPGIELSRTAPQAASLSQEELEFAAAGEFDPAEVARDETQPVLRLAVFLPDGSALLSRPVWLSDEDGRVGRLGVNTFTGLPWFKRQDNDDPLQTPPEEVPDEAEDFIPEFDEANRDEEGDS